MRIVKKYWLPLLALVLAIGLAVWRIGYLERTNTSLSMEIGSREALQNGEPITLENPVVLYKNEPYVPLKEIVERLGGTTDGKTYTLHGAETAVSGVERNGVLYTPFSYLWDSHIPQIRWDKSRNRVIITEAPEEITLTRRWLFWRHKTVRGLRVGDSEARFLDLYGSPDARDEMMIDLLRVTIENGIVTDLAVLPFAGSVSSFAKLKCFAIASEFLVNEYPSFFAPFFIFFPFVNTL